MTVSNQKCCLVSLFICVLLAISFPSKSTELPEFTLYSYHLKPPYIVDQQAEIGMYYDIVRYLNKYSTSYRYKLTFLPRKRLEFILNNNQLDGGVIGVNPIWFDDKLQQKYLWTPPLFNDRDDVVSLASNPINYKNASSLKGKTVGGVRGFYYWGIDELVAKGEIERVDSINEQALLNMLEAKRLDAIVIGRPTMHFFKNSMELSQPLYIAKTPHDLFMRHILLPKRFTLEHQQLSLLVAQVTSDSHWQAYLAQHR